MREMGTIDRFSMSLQQRIIHHGSSGIVSIPGIRRRKGAQRKDILASIGPFDSLDRVVPWSESRRGIDAIALIIKRAGYNHAGALDKPWHEWISMAIF
jgi:hypothetical protein